MTNEELNTELYKKLFAEQEKFKGWLVTQPPDEILNHAYEYVMREDIVLALEYHDLSDERAKALLASPSPLDEIFHDFEKIEGDHMDTIRGCIESRADKNIEAQREALRNLPVYIFSATFAKEHGELVNNTVVTTIMSNCGLFKALEELNIEYAKTAVGDKNVHDYMAKNNNCIGGEQSGHIIFLDYNPTGDGILTSLMLIQTILEENKTASELTSIIKLYPQVLINAKVNADKKYDYEKDEDIKKAIENVEKEFAGNGRVVIRPSGTEPLVRVMIEGEDQEYITKRAKEIVELIEKKLK